MPYNYNVYNRPKKANKRVAKCCITTYEDRVKYLLNNTLFCGVCGAEINKKLPENNPYHPIVQYIKPLKEGGEDTVENMEVLHYICKESMNKEHVQEPIGGSILLPQYIKWNEV